MNKQIIILLITLATLSLTSCNKGKVDELTKKTQELARINQLQDSLLNDFMMYFNDFEDNLSLIKEREQIISMSTDDAEFEVDRKQKVLDDIQMINSLLDENKAIIDSLSDRLALSNGRAGELKRSVNRLTKRLAYKTEEIANLKTELETMNFTVASLNVRIDTLTYVSKNLRQQTTRQAQKIVNQDSTITQQTEHIAAQTEKINTAFVITGTAKELREQNILSKEGGLAGIGATKKLKSDFDPASFERIDITQTNMIPISSRKAEILTAHPSDSYVLNSDTKKSIDNLQITDPDKFWSTSKYLVVVVN